MKNNLGISCSTLSSSKVSAKNMVCSFKLIDTQTTYSKSFASDHRKLYCIMYCDVFETIWKMFELLSIKYFLVMWFYINYYIYHVHTTFVSAPFCCQDFLCIQLYVSMLIVFYLNDFINAEPIQNERNFYILRNNIKDICKGVRIISSFSYDLPVSTVY